MASIATTEGSAFLSCRSVAASVARRLRMPPVSLSVRSSMARTTELAFTGAGDCSRNIQSYALPSMPSASELHPAIIARMNAVARTAMYPSVTLPGHCFLDFIHFTRQRRTEDLRAILCHEDDVLDPNPDSFFGKIHAGFDRDHHSRLQRE